MSLAVVTMLVVWVLRGQLLHTAASRVGAAAQQHPDLVEIAALKRTLRAGAEDARTRQRLGLLELRHGNAVSAEHHLRRAVELGASRSSVIAPLGKALLLRAEHERLLAEIHSNPDLARPVEAEVLSLRGRAELALGRLEAGREAVEAAARLDPESLPVMLAVFQLRRAEGALDAAEEALVRAIATHRDDLETAWIAGWFALERGRYADAVLRFQQVRDHAPEGMLTAWVRSALLGQAEALVLDGRPADARRNVEALLAIDGDDPSANYLAAVIYFHAGEADLVRQRLLRLANLGSDHPAALPLLAVVEQARGNLELATAYLARHLVAHPDDHNARDLLIALQVRLGDLVGATKALGDAPREAAMRAEFQVWRGWLALREGRWQNGYVHFSAAAAAAPSDSRLQRLAWTAAWLEQPRVSLSNLKGPEPGFGVGAAAPALERMRQGDLKGALAVTEGAPASGESDPELALVRGVLHLRAGLPDRARADFEAGSILWARVPERIARMAGALPAARTDIAAQDSKVDATSFFYLVDWRSYVARFELKPDAPPTLFDEGPVFGWAEESGLSQLPQVSFERRPVNETEPEINPRKPTRPATVPPLSVMVFMVLLILQRVVSRVPR